MTTYTERNNLENIRAKLESLGIGPIVIYDPRSIGEDIILEMCDIARHLGERPITSLGLYLESLDALSIVLPLDQRDSYAAGRPVVIYPVIREDREPNPTHRPVDTPAVKSAKRALAIGTYRLLAGQTEVELARVTRNREPSRAQARDLAVLTIGRAIWREGRDLHDDGKIKLVEGLVDRASRIVADFMGVKKPTHVSRADATRTRERIRNAGRDVSTIIGEIDEDHRDRASALFDNQVRAIAHDRAMERWSAAVRDGQPISRPQAIEICNGYSDRAPASELMRIAIAGDLNPADVHRNQETARMQFEVGRLLGRLRREQSITLSASHAQALAPTFNVFYRQRLEDGRPNLKSEKHACDYMLAEEALTYCDFRAWDEVLTRILATGVAEVLGGKRE